MLNTSANLTLASAILCRYKILKINNGLIHIAKPFQEFCQEFDITHNTDIPYNSQGQSFAGRANRQLKRYFKIKERHQHGFKRWCRLYN